MISGGLTMDLNSVRCNLVMEATASLAALIWVQSPTIVNVHTLAPFEWIFVVPLFRVDTPQPQTSSSESIVDEKQWNPAFH